MKNTAKFLLTAIFIIAITSCNKEDVDLPFNKLSDEENKELIENSAIDAIQNVDELKDEAAVEASVNLGMLFAEADPISDAAGKKSMVTTVIESVASLNTEGTNFYSVMKSVAGPAEMNEDPETLRDIWEMLVGTYEWNATTEDWDYSGTPTDAIIFKFPAAEDGTTNNATLTISDYESVTIATPVDNEYDGDVPTSLKWDFTVNNTSVMSFTFAAVYNDEGIPESLAANLIIGVFEFSADATNNETEISESFKFTKAKDVILEISGAINGDFTQENIDNNTEVHTYTSTDYIYNEITQQYDPVTYTNSWEEVHTEEMVETVSGKFRVDDISVGCTGEVEMLVDSLKIIYSDDRWEDPNYDDQEAAIEEARIINRTMNMYCINEDNKKKIADVEAYVVERNYGDGNVNYYVDFRLIFGDGSLVDLETYFETGFERFVEEVNGIIRDINSQYETDIDLITY